MLRLRIFVVFRLEGLHLPQDYPVEAAQQLVVIAHQHLLDYLFDIFVVPGLGPTRF